MKVLPQTMFKIEPIIVSQNSEVAQMVIQIQQVEFKVPISIEEQPDLNDIVNFYNKNKGQFWVATMHNEVIGCIAMIDCGLGIGCIRKMFVKAQFRGKELSVAQKLLETLENYALKNYFSVLYLGTIPKLEAAVAFYKKNGFMPILKENLPSVFPIMAVDTLFFEKKL